MRKGSVAVTGAGGYIGSVLVGRLLAEGYVVDALDRFFFGEEVLSHHRRNPRLRLKRCDIRDLKPRDFENVWAVVDLAALSNDPSAELQPLLTVDINEAGRLNVANAAKRAGVARYLFSSSCSIYGAGESAQLTEKSPLKPLTVYAKCCARVEKIVREMNAPDFTVVALRNATLFGLSHRMRFDLVVNTMTSAAFETGRIHIAGGGQQWRPLVHVQDVATAFLTALKAPIKQISGEAFNIGLTNMRVRQIADLVRETVPKPVKIVTEKGGSNDARSYNVCFDRASAVLGFTARRKITDGVREVYKALENKRVIDDDLTKTVAWYRYLLRAEHILKRIELNDRIL